MNVSNENIKSGARTASYGTKGLTIVDRFGIWLSKKAILAAIGNRRNLDVLEIGCGYAARNLLAIEEHATHLLGVDFNISDQAKAHPKFSAIEAPALDALKQLADRKFDLILIISVLEHLDTPGDVLTRCRDLLNPGGILLINVPTWRGKIFLEFSAYRLGLSPKEEIDDHKMYYDKRDLWPLLVKSGFLPGNIAMNYHKFTLNLFAIAKRGLQ